MLHKLLFVVYLFLWAAQPKAVAYDSSSKLPDQKAGVAQTAMTPNSNRSPWEVSLLDALNISLAFLAIALSIVAIGYAVKQKRDAAETMKLTKSNLETTESTSEKLNAAVTALGETTDTLSSLAAQLPTRYVGKFPDNITQIINLLRLATREIVIVSDFAGYSSYSDPAAFRDYYNAVENCLRMNPTMTVKLFVYDSLQRQRWLQMFYRRTTYPDLVFKNPEDSRLATFIKRTERRNIKIHDYDSLISAMMDDEQRCIYQFEDLERCDCYEVQKTLPIFLWIIDNRECIFVFENEHEITKNYFSFQTRDGSLIEYFGQYLRDIMSAASAHPRHTIDEVSEMNMLVPQLGLCTVINNRLAPCRYHHDRLDVQFYEQLTDSGVRDIDEFTVEVSPIPPIVELFEKMEDKKMPAGSWSLMACHRDWLIERISEHLKAIDQSLVGEPSILQLGTAGPVHYFSTAKLIAEALIKSGMPLDKHAALHTVERCLTPVLCVQSLLDKVSSDEDLGRDWAAVDARGLKKALDQSFYQIGADKPFIRERLRHVVRLADICDDRFGDANQSFDFVIGHFTFSMWANVPAIQCRKGYENVSGALKSGGKLLVALSEFHNPMVASIDVYHEHFASVGLHLLSANRVWDIYDFSPSDRKKILFAQRAQQFRKRVVLAEYQKS